MKIYFQNNYNYQYSHIEKNKKSYCSVKTLEKDVFAKSQPPSFKGKLDFPLILPSSQMLSKFIKSMISNSHPTQTPLKPLPIIRKFVPENDRVLENAIMCNETCAKRFLETSTKKCLLPLMQIQKQRHILLKITESYSDEEYKKFLTLLDNEQIKKMITKKSCNLQDLHSLKNCNDIEFQQLLKILNNKIFKTIIDKNRISGSSLRALSTLGNDAHDNLDMLVHNKHLKRIILSKFFNGNNVMGLAHLNKNKIEKLAYIANHSRGFKTLIDNKSVDFYDLVKISQLKTNEQQQLVQLLNNKLIIRQINNNKMNTTNLIAHARSDTEKFQAKMKLLSNPQMQILFDTSKGHKPPDLNTFCTFTKHDIQHFNIFLNNEKLYKLISDKKMDFDCLSVISASDENRFAYFMHLIKNQKFYNLLQNKIYNVNNIDPILQLIRLSNTQKDQIPVLLKDEKVYSILQNNANYSLEMLGDFAVVSDINFNHLSFRNKKELLDNFNRYLEDKSITCQAKEFIKLQRNKVISMMESITTPIKTSRENNQLFWHNFMSNNNPQVTENIKRIEPVLEKYGKDGIPLKYKRTEFVADLCKTLKNCDSKKQQQILAKLQIKLSDDKKGYDGLLNLYNLNANDKHEKRVLEIGEKFLLHNEVQTGDNRTDKLLNSLIKGIPEFVNFIGKKHHGTHQYTIDAHILKVLQETVSNPEYEKLSDIDKTCLKLATILHDVGKQEGKVDFGHEFPSAIIANDILSKFNMPTQYKKRVVELIKNHNWYQLYNSKSTDEMWIATMFRGSSDFQLAKIFAQSDLKGVSEKFYNTHIQGFQNASDRISSKIEYLHKTSNIIFQTQILNTNKIPTVKYKGQEYKILDLTKIPDGVDLTKYGLSCKSKKDIRFLFHTGNLETMYTITKPFNDSVICASLISPDKSVTYANKNIGMLLEVDNKNIINSANSNLSSGRERGFKDFVKMMFSEDREQQYQMFKEIFKSNGYDFTDKDFVQIFKQVSGKQHLSQINDINVNNQIVTKKNFVDIYKQLEEKLMRFSDKRHNEINVYNPNLRGIIVLNNSLDALPTDTLEFIRMHNLPIIVLN